MLTIRSTAVGRRPQPDFVPLPRMTAERRSLEAQQSRAARASAESGSTTKRGSTSSILSCSPAERAAARPTRPAASSRAAGDDNIGELLIADCQLQIDLRIEFRLHHRQFSFLSNQQSQSAISNFKIAPPAPWLRP